MCIVGTIVVVLVFYPEHVQCFSCQTDRQTDGQTDRRVNRSIKVFRPELLFVSHHVTSRVMTALISELVLSAVDQYYRWLEVILYKIIPLYYLFIYLFIPCRIFSLY